MIIQPDMQRFIGIFTVDYYCGDIGHISFKPPVLHTEVVTVFLFSALQIKGQIRIQSKIFTLAIGTAISDTR